MKSKIAVWLSAIILIAGCSRPDETEKRNEAGGLHPLAFTLYSEKTELFVEFSPLIKGVNSKFAAHFTLLGENFLPLEEGKITVSLVIGDKGIRNVSDKASSPGIFRLNLSPNIVGKGKLIFDIETKNYTDRIVIENIEVYPDEKTAAKKSGHGAEGEITFLKEQAWKTEFATMEVKASGFHEIIATGGEILPAPGDEMLITAKSDGIVIFNGKNCYPGAEINSGEFLFLVSSEGMTDQNISTRFKETKADFERAKADLERAENLSKDKIISQKEYLEIKNRYEAAQSAYNEVAQHFSGNGTRAVSPMKGVLKNILVHEGQFVKMGDALATVSQNRKINLRADVSQKYFNKLARIKSANFRTPDGTVFDTDELNGKMLGYGKSTGDGSAFIPVTFEIDNRGEILSGSFIEMYLKTERIEDAITIPKSALIEEQGTFFVYVQISGESFTKREVKTGNTDGKNVHILSGLNENERVVIKGGYQIKLSVASGTMPAHGHEH